MRLFKTILWTAVFITVCMQPSFAENEDLKAWEVKVAAGKYAGIEKEIEDGRKEALEKSDYVRLSAIEEIQNQIKRRKAIINGGAKADNATTLNDALRMQMIMLQSQVEKFAKQHHGKFPIALNDEFKGYFPMITLNNSKSTAPFYNPFTKKQDWFTIKPLNKLEQANEEDALPQGQIVYCPVNRGATYAIIAGANDGKLLRGKDGKILIMTKK